MFGAVADKRDRNRTCQRGALPLASELRVRAELLRDQRVGCLHLAQLHGRAV